MLGQMVKIRKSDTSAYYAIKLAQQFMTPQECVPLLVGMVKTEFFDNVYKRISSGCATDSQFAFSIAVANLFTKLLVAIKTLPVDLLEVVWLSHKESMQQNTHRDRSGKTKSRRKSLRK